MTATITRLDLRSLRVTIPGMLETRYSPPPSSSWSRINLIMFVLAHLTMVYGLRFIFDTFISLAAGIVVGLGAYGLWRFRREVWSRPSLGLVFGAATLTQVVVYERALEPPPEPPPLAITRGEDGRYYVNRGGRQTLGQQYVVLPAPEEEGSSPRVLGVGKAVPPATDDRSAIEWMVLRRKYRDRSYYRIRPLYPNERVPTPADYVTLLEPVGPGRVRIDAGSEQGVRKDEAYFLFSPGMPGNGGYLVVDAVEKDSAQGFLVGGNPPLPHDADRLGPVSNLISLTLSRGELAFLAGRSEEARTAFQQALELSGGKNDRARERLEKLPPPAAAAPAPSPAD